MPLTKSAIKKQKQDLKIEKKNELLEQKVEIAIKKALKTSEAKAVSEAFSAIDKAVKNKLFHKNKAARLKSQISKTSPKVTTETKPVKTAKITKKSKAKK